MRSHQTSRPGLGSSNIPWGAVSLYAILFVVSAWQLDARAHTGSAGGLVRLPFVARTDACAPIPRQTYVAIAVDGPHPNLPAESHPDLNLAVRGYELTSAPSQLVDYGGPSDGRAPQLDSLFSEERLPVFGGVYRAFDWNWTEMRRGQLIEDPPVTSLGLRAVQDEALCLPRSGYGIGDGCEALVLYADSQHITFQYTREDSVAHGYTVHVENVCVEPRLVALYRACDANGRHHLPALRPQQPFAQARGTEVVVAIRDHGRFLDPRSRKDWWQQY